MNETCKIYYCYKATNKVNGKVYIGFASDPHTRWRNHKRDAETGRGYVFHDAIRKHGWDAFEFEVICCGRDKRMMMEYVEPALIEQYHSSIGQHGYNMHRKVLGASSRTPDKRTRRKRYSEEVKQKIGDRMKGNRHRVGCKDSDSVRKRKSEVLKGNKRSLGRIQSPEIRQLISTASQAMWEARRVALVSGKKLTEISVRQIRDACQSGVSRKIVAEQFGIHAATVGEIIRHEIWKQVV